MYDLTAVEICYDRCSDPVSYTHLQYDTLVSRVQKGRLDGIIVAANCIGCYTTKERMVEFMHHYDGIPCVLVSSDLEGYVLSLIHI